MNGKLCSKCKKETSLNYHRYCYACLRMMSGRPAKPKFHRDPTNKTMCSKCKVKPRLPYHNYCQECKNATFDDWAKARGGSWNCRTPEQKRRATARKYIHNLIKRGHVKPKPCLVCGKDPAEVHHWDYERMTLNVDWFCHEHHVITEQLKKKGLTKERIMEYLLKQHGSSAPIATAPPDNAGPLRSV